MRGAPLELDPALSVDAEGSPVRVYPGVDRVPLNGVVLELAFGESIALGPHQIHLVDQFGNEVAGAIRKVTWNQDLTVATVEPEGVVAGKRYVLNIEGLTTRAGQPVPPRYHSFFVLPEDKAAPTGAGVRVEGAPHPGSTATVNVRFPEPVRRGGLGSLTVMDGGVPASGTWELDDNEEVAVFTPAGPWSDRTVTVSIGSGIEDLGGNALVDPPSGHIVPMVPVGAAPKD